jgi:signal transduction histidine kinase
MAWARDVDADPRELHAFVRDLVALSAMPAWWAGRSPDAIAESLRDLLAELLPSERVYVRLGDGSTFQTTSAIARATDDGDVSTSSRNGDSASDVIAPLRFVSHPIGWGGELGRFAIGSRRPEFPSPLESLLMQMTANEAAAALRQASLLAGHEQAVCALRERAEQLDARANLGQLALSDAPLEYLLREGVRVVQESLSADFCELFELEPENESLTLASVAGWGARPDGRAHAECVLSQANYTLRMGAPIITDDSRMETRFEVNEMMHVHGIQSSVSVVLHDAESPLGVLGAHSCTRRVFTSEHVRFLQSAANLFALSIQRRRVDREREMLLERTTAAHAEAERASLLKTQHLAVMSHELRTPLNAIAGYVELMEMEIHGVLTAAQRNDLARIRHNQQYLLSLINNVLTFMKLEQGRLEWRLTSVSVSEMLEATEQVVRSLIDAKNLRYRWQGPECDVRVLADPGKLQQILVNLLSNATKFTEPGGAIEVECVAGDRTVRIQVRDNGCGIAGAELERVFEPFVQVGDARRGTTEGTGLGLAISREYAKGMHGRLTAASERGKGSVFTLELPRSA